MAISSLIVYCLCNKCTGKCTKTYQPINDATEMRDIRRGSKNSTSPMEERTTNKEETKPCQSPKKRKVNVIENSDDDKLQDAVPKQPTIKSPNDSRKEDKPKMFRYSGLYGNNN